MLEVIMATTPPSSNPPPSNPPPKFGPGALALAAEAKVLSGIKLDQLVRRLQRQSGRSREDCWRFVIQHGLKCRVEHRRWTDEEIDEARELLAKYPVEEVAKKLKRTSRALRCVLQRNHLRVRDIRCDCFSVEALANILHVRKSEILHWIEQKWLQAVARADGKRVSYTIMPEALIQLYKHHLKDLLKRRIPNQALFDAYFQYCYSPKHTEGEQLLHVRHDKKERAAYAAAKAGKDPAADPDDEEDEDEEDGDEDGDDAA
jgi:hypothetical protein